MSQRISGYAREANDRYETPEWVTLALIPHIPPIKTVWEPACGSGKMIRALQTAGFEVIGSDIAGGVDFRCANPTPSSRTHPTPWPQSSL
jgi:hypothetical protein